MNNEPVAWMVNNKFYEDIFEAEHYSKFTNKPMIPLYTHPVKKLTLTRDEIRDVWHEFPASFTLTPLTIEFARAILKKASEK